MRNTLKRFILNKSENGEEEKVEKQKKKESEICDEKREC
jgi:hypothetical protein